MGQAIRNDKLIIGAGFYGLYSALYCGKKGQTVTVLEIESAPFTRATYVNQARVHVGYHYPRSLFTAMKSAGYFKRFSEDYAFCIHEHFQQIYATSRHFSWTDAKEFRKFCKNAKIPCKDLPVEQYFQPGLCDGAFLTDEYTYDARLLCKHLTAEIEELPNVNVLCEREITRIVKKSDCYEIYAMHQGKEELYSAPFVMNATYASVNEVLQKVEGINHQEFDLKYELCEIILCKAAGQLKNIGITVMDGPFFSIMPFGKTGYHSLTSVTFTPHETCYGVVPKFECEAKGLCNEAWLGNCNNCPAKPVSAWEYMSTLARKYMREGYDFSYEKSLFSMKPILKASEIDDSRPTVIKRLEQKEETATSFISVLSGKINTVYDLDEYLD